MQSTAATEFKIARWFSESTIQLLKPLQNASGFSHRA